MVPVGSSRQGRDSTTATQMGTRRIGGLKPALLVRTADPTPPCPLTVGAGRPTFSPDRGPGSTGPGGTAATAPARPPDSQRTALSGRRASRRHAAGISGGGGGASVTRRVRGPPPPPADDPTRREPCPPSSAGIACSPSWSGPGPCGSSTASSRRRCRSCELWPSSSCLRSSGPFLHLTIRACLA